MFGNALQPDWAELSPIHASKSSSDGGLLTVTSDAGPLTLSVYAPKVFRLRGGRRDLFDYRLIRPGSEQMSTVQSGIERSQLTFD